MKWITRSLVCLTLVGLAALPAAARNPFWFGDGRFGQPASSGNNVNETIVDLALATPELSTLVQAVLKAELAETLDEDGNFTVFAPTNAAFDAAGIVPADVDKETLTAVLLDHVASGEFNSRFLRSQARDGMRLPTLGGLNLNIDASTLAVNGAGLVIRDIQAANGTIFVIDRVLTRPAPSIADRAIAAAALSTLVEAVVKAELVDTLANGGPFTVFAPTNAAFADISVDPAVVDKETLTSVLLDHVVPGEFTPDQLAELRSSRGSLRTLGGLDLTFGGRGSAVNGNRVIGAPITAENGIVYVIDGVLLED